MRQIRHILAMPTLDRLKTHKTLMEAIRFTFGRQYPTRKTASSNRIPNIVFSPILRNRKALKSGDLFLRLR
jgi:hypothetical protein